MVYTFSLWPFLEGLCIFIALFKIPAGILGAVAQIFELTFLVFNYLKMEFKWTLNELGILRYKFSALFKHLIIKLKLLINLP